MRIELDTSVSPIRIELAEGDDFHSFDALVKGSGAAREALSQLGPVAADGGYVFIEVERLKALAGDRATDPAWLAGLEGMTAYAAAKGWVDDAGRLRAHVICG